MTNQQLQQLFKNTCLSTDNVFDAYIILSKKESEYKNSGFHKATKKSIYDAYEIYCKHEGSILRLFKTLSEMDIQDITAAMVNISSIFDLQSILDQYEGEDKSLLEEMLKAYNVK